MVIVQDIWNALGGLLLVILAIEILPNLWKEVSRRVRYGDQLKPDLEGLVGTGERSDQQQAPPAVRLSAQAGLDSDL